LDVAIAAQSFDDKPETSATEMKIDNATTNMTDSTKRLLYTRINNAHALITPDIPLEKVEEVAVNATKGMSNYAIEFANKQISLGQPFHIDKYFPARVTFGAGLHPVEDYLPHANLSGHATAGHAQQKNESGTPSVAPGPMAKLSEKEMVKATSADKTHENPNKALATLFRVMELWSNFQKNEEPLKPLTKEQFEAISEFVNARTDTEKKQAMLKALKVAGASESEINQVFDLLENKSKRITYMDSLLEDPWKKADYENAWRTWSKYKVDKGQGKLMREGKQDITPQLNRAKAFYDLTPR
jgi:hypothetical protein